MRFLAPLVLTLVTLLSGCSASEERVQEDFDAYVAERNDCSDVSDCTAQIFDCPLGCSVAFNKDHEEEIQKKADKLIKRYERGGRSCDYKCQTPGTLVCEDSACGFSE